MRALLDRIRNFDRQDNVPTSQPQAADDTNLVYKNTPLNAEDYSCQAVGCRAPQSDITAYNEAGAPFRGLCSKHLPLRNAAVKAAHEARQKETDDIRWY